NAARPLLGEAGLAIAVLALALGIFSNAAAQIEFHGDEGGYISQARYFGFAFLLHDLKREEWSDTFATHAQPMMTRYVIVGWLWARGYALQDIPLRFDHYDFLKSLDENRALGLVPDR